MTSRLPLVHLVRHGEVENPDGVIYGRLPGFGLSDRGRAQAASAARHLGARIASPPRVIASPLQRAQETARILMEQLGATELVLDDRLTEADSGFEGLPRRFAPGPYLRRVVRTSSWRRAERPIGVARRMGRAVREVAADADTDHVVIVSHQFPIVMARIALTWGVTDDAGPIAVRAAPLLFRRTGCALASVSSLRFDDRERASIDYWEP
ncbi:MAG: histidine phosphatase family protein [Myxococcales bacterium]|nr:histidine phosphatase family protein [Myxococcales bacterium]